MHLFCLLGFLSTYMLVSGEITRSWSHLCNERINPPRWMCSSDRCCCLFCFTLDLKLCGLLAELIKPSACGSSRLPVLVTTR
uniref:Secreted protein n=1 Tax=Oryzias latipes TaxID=8090 RepID=A0A3P9MBJ4_ORYLA